MALSGRTVNRLYNWKFESAKRDAADQEVPPTQHEVDAIRALSDAFGNVGWFDSALAVVIRLAVHDLIGDTD